MTLQRFQRSLESLYGDLDAIPDPTAWTPPPNSGGHRGRYLWTDAFGVLNLLTLHREYNRNAGAVSARGANANTNLGSDHYLRLAQRLVATVHDVLGHTRDGHARLPHASDANPLGGGLRIGKLDPHGLDGDGQYHHYLTLWMFALNRLALASGDPAYNAQAVALARAIHPRFFLHRTTDCPRMVWKMSVDLATPLVASEGNLDPVDGFVVFRLLQATHNYYRSQPSQSQREDQGQAQSQGEAEGEKEEVLSDEIADYAKVMERKGEYFVSDDMLDLGMTLWTAHWFVEKEEWAGRLAGQCLEQIYDLLEVKHHLRRDVRRRLAFREFGTCMGIQCMADQITEKEQSVDLRVYADRILASWEPYMELSLATDDATPQDLRPITRAMYSAALIPGAFQRGYLGPEPPT